MTLQVSTRPFPKWAAVLAALLLGPLGAISASGAGRAPEWVQSLPTGAWSPISLNTLSDVDPQRDPEANPRYPNNAPWRGNSGQTGVIDAWNGGAFASGYGESGSLIVWGGGHQDYYGNEIYAFDLKTLRWNRVTKPYAGTISYPYTDGIFPDGSPSPPHIYDQIEYFPPTNSLIVLRTMASNSPSNVPVAAQFSFDTGRWTRSPRNTESHHNSGGWSAYDESRRVIWAEGGSGTTAFTSFNPQARASDGQLGSWANYRWKVGITDAVAALDPQNDILLVTAFRSGTDIHAIDLKNPSASSVRIKQSGDIPARSSGHGWEWSDTRQAFIYWSPGTGVYEVKLSGNDWRNDTWVWTQLTSGSNTSPSAKARPYSRFRIARFDDAEVAIVVTGINQPVYAFRIPGTPPVVVKPLPPENVTVQ